MDVDAVRAYLTARLDEDEYAALVAKDEPDGAAAVHSGVWTYDEAKIRVTDDQGYAIVKEYDTDRAEPWRVGPHVALHDPARVLHEVEAKRRILALWEQMSACRYASAEDEGRAWLMDEVLAQVAQCWSARSDFPEELRLT